MKGGLGDFERALGATRTGDPQPAGVAELEVLASQ